MTTEEAHSIMTQLQQLEFPYAFNKARKIALLKVCLSSLLLPGHLLTKELGRWNPNNVETFRCHRPEQ
jgi:hypothetical protein